MSKRFEYIDMAKGLGMIAIIWGHIVLSGWSFVLAYAFDIPLFFLLAGMMNRPSKSFSNLFIRRAKRLLLPYLIFSLISWLFWVSYNAMLGNDLDGAIASLLQTFIAQGSGSYLIHNAPLWFVTCLFVVEMLYYFINKLPTVFNIVVCLCLAIIGHFMLNNNIPFDFTKLPWNIEAAMSAMLFYCLGNLFSKYVGVERISEFYRTKKSTANIAIIVCSVLFVGGALWNGHITLGSNNLGKSTIVLYVVGLLGSIGALLICTGVDNSKISLAVITKRWLSWIGKNSFYFMAVHVPIKGVIKVLLAKLIGTSSSVISESLLFGFLTFIPSFIVTAITVAMINFMVYKFKTLRSSQCNQ